MKPQSQRRVVPSTSHTITVIQSEASTISVIQSETSTISHVPTIDLIWKSWSRQRMNGLLAFFEIEFHHDSIDPQRIAGFTRDSRHRCGPLRPQDVLHFHGFYDGHLLTFFDSITLAHR